VEVSGQLLAPAAVPSGEKTPAPMEGEAGGGGGKADVDVCGSFGQEITFSCAGIRTQDRPARTLTYSYYDIPASSLFISMCMNMDGLHFVYSLNETAWYDSIERTNKIVYDSGDGVPRVE
jgi:hypothetical protein